MLGKISRISTGELQGEQKGIPSAEEERRESTIGKEEVGQEEVGKEEVGKEVVGKEEGGCCGDLTWWVYTTNGICAWEVQWETGLTGNRNNCKIPFKSTL